MEDAGFLRVLRHLVEKLTDKKSTEWDVHVLRKLKGFCKAKGDSAIKNAFGLIMDKCRDPHARASHSNFFRCLRKNHTVLPAISEIVMTDFRLHFPMPDISGLKAISDGAEPSSCSQASK